MNWAARPSPPSMRLAPEIELFASAWIGGALVASYGDAGATRLTGTAELVGGGRLGLSVWP